MEPIKIIVPTKMAVDQANWEPYQLGRQAITIVQLKAIILGRQPLYTVPVPSPAQVDEMVLPSCSS